MIEELKAVVDVSKKIDPIFCEDPRGRIKPKWDFAVFPRNSEEIVKTLKIARKSGAIIVPFGGGTGLVGGQFYDGGRQAICMSMSKMNSIEVDADSVLVGAGAILGSVHSAVDSAGRHFPLNLASSGSAQIGGLIATNAGGVNVLRYGSMGELVLGLEVVLADGTILNTTTDLRKDNTGYTIDRLMIGSEGTLGVITKARLRIFKFDVAKAVIMGSVMSPKAALDLLYNLSSERAHISAFELISGEGLRFRESVNFAPSPIGKPDWSVLIELGGSEDEVNEAIAFVSGNLNDAVLAQSEGQAASLWNVRETIPAANRKVGAIASHDISLPIQAQSDFIDSMQNILKPHNVKINCFGHLGDGNLHYNLFPTVDKSRSDYDAGLLSDLVYQNVINFKGSISAEHGIGRFKAAMMSNYGLAEKQNTMRKIKDALDPHNLLNPGVFFPER